MCVTPCVGISPSRVAPFSPPTRATPSRRSRPFSAASLPSRWTSNGSIDIFSEDFSVEALETEEADHQEREDSEDETPKELIFKLQRRGEGWGEEIMPSVTVEWRPINLNKRIRFRSQGPDPWQVQHSLRSLLPTERLKQEGSLEMELLRAGVPKEDVEKVGAAAAAWRVTPKGRPLIDRRRRARVQRNARGVVDHLVNVCGVPLGFYGVGKILMTAPQILLAKVSDEDRWNVRVVELAAFMHQHGHCNVPKDWGVSPTLGRWVQRQRVSHAQGDMREEREQILHALGFRFGDCTPTIDLEWEKHFELYTDWISQQRQRHLDFDETGLEWFCLGGWRAARLAVWAIHQRQLKAENHLPEDISRKLDYFNFDWEMEAAPTRLREWMQRFGELTVAAERQKGANKKNGRSYSSSDISLASRQSSRVPAWLQSLQTRPEWKLDQISVAEIPRLDSLSSLDLARDLRNWLEDQRFLWTQGRLSTNKIALFYALGVELNPYSHTEWLQLAHLATHFLNNFEIEAPIQQEAVSSMEGLPSGPNLLVMPGNIVSVSEAGDIVERVDLKTFQAMRDELNVIETEPETATLQLLDTPATQLLLEPASEVDIGWTERAQARIQTWVLTQIALHREAGLTRNDIRYLASIGLSWILSKDIMEMSDGHWWSHYEQLRSVAHLEALPPHLETFLSYQRALQRLGFLSNDRREGLEAMGMSFAFPQRTESDKIWDTKITELIKHTTHPQKVPLPSELESWLLQQLKQIKLLSGIKSLQIRTLKSQLN